MPAQDEYPLVPSPVCNRAGCRACDNYGYVLMEDAKERIARFWRAAPTVTINSVSEMHSAFDEMEQANGSERRTGKA